MVDEYNEEHGVMTVKKLLDRDAKKGPIVLTKEEYEETLANLRAFVGYQVLCDKHWWFYPTIVFVTILGTPYLYVRNKLNGKD